MVIRAIYSIFLGILVALFVGWGIAAFYPAPVRPIYPISITPAPVPVSVPDKTSAPVTPPTTAQQEEYGKKSLEFDQTTYPDYQRRVSILATIGAILVLIISLMLMHQIELISDGLLIGGVLIQVYAIIRSFLGHNNIYSFLTVTVGLVIALVLGYIKFIRPQSSQTKVGK